MIKLPIAFQGQVTVQSLRQIWGSTIVPVPLGTLSVSLPISAEPLSCGFEREGSEVHQVWFSVEEFWDCPSPGLWSRHGTAPNEPGPGGWEVWGQGLTNC